MNHTTQMYFKMNQQRKAYVMQLGEKDRYDPIIPDRSDMAEMLERRGFYYNPSHSIFLGRRDDEVRANLTIWKGGLRHELKLATFVGYTRRIRRNFNTLFDHLETDESLAELLDDITIVVTDFGDLVDAELKKRNYDLNHPTVEPRLATDEVGNIITYPLDEAWGTTILERTKTPHKTFYPTLKA